MEGLGAVSVVRKPMDDEGQGLLIGKKGATIASIQEETGCALEIRRGAGSVAILGRRRRSRRRRC